MCACVVGCVCACVSGWVGVIEEGGFGETGGMGENRMEIKAADKSVSTRTELFEDMTEDKNSLFVSICCSLVLLAQENIFLSTFEHSRSTFLIFASGKVNF